jgi:hypothetical protein
MASARTMIERRRSSRVLIRIPVQLFTNDIHGDPVDALAEAIAVSRNGALIRGTFEAVLGSRIEVLNGLSQAVQEFRVIRVTRSAEAGIFELGLEMLYPTRSFWGVQFPDDSL